MADTIYGRSGSYEGGRVVLPFRYPGQTPISDDLDQTTILGEIKFGRRHSSRSKPSPELLTPVLIGDGQRRLIDVFLVGPSWGLEFTSVGNFYVRLTKRTRPSRFDTEMTREG